MFCKMLKTVFMKSNKNKALEKHLGVLSDGEGIVSLVIGYFYILNECCVKLIFCLGFF